VNKADFDSAAGFLLTVTRSGYPVKLESVRTFGNSTSRSVSVANPSALHDGKVDRGRRVASDFKGRHFGDEIVLWAVRWHCRYGISYRDLEQMMAELGVSVDHSTIYRWVQRVLARVQRAEKQ
jgi:hypothetical protein